MGEKHSSGGRAARVVAQAKINLFLRVLAREASGFHQLETLFQRLELGDDVVVRVGGQGQTLDCRGADVGPVEHNLAWRAAQAYVQHRGWPSAFAVEIEKRIPVGGGLGGGSADAGAVLRCLNALAPEPLGADELLVLAGPLGSDVPFLTAEAPLALAWGRGERMLVLPALPARDVWLWTSPTGVATADAYRWLADARGGYSPTPAALQVASLSSWEGVARSAENDFETIVPQRDATIGARLGTFRVVQRDAEDRGFSLLAGTGATVYAVTDGRLMMLPAMMPTLALGGAVVRTRTATRVAAVEMAD